MKLKKIQNGLRKVTKECENCGNYIFFWFNEDKLMRVSGRGNRYWKEGGKIVVECGKCYAQYEMENEKN